MLHVLYLYDYYRGYMAWVCACTTGAGASCAVIHTNFVPALMYQQWYRTSVWDIANKIRELWDAENIQIVQIEQSIKQKT